MQFDPGDFPAVTYQHVQDVAELLEGVPAVPTLTLLLHEAREFNAALARIIDEAQAQADVASELGYPISPISPYPGNGVRIVIDGPGAAQVLVVSGRRMAATDVADLRGLMDAIFEDGTVGGELEMEGSVDLGGGLELTRITDPDTELGAWVRGADGQEFCDCGDTLDHGYPVEGVVEVTPADVDEAQRKGLTPEEMAEAMSHALGEAATYPTADDDMAEEFTCTFGEVVELDPYEIVVAGMLAPDYGDEVYVHDARALVPLEDEVVRAVGGVDLRPELLYREGQWYDVEDEAAPFYGVVEDKETQPDGTEVYQVGPDGWYYYAWQMDRCAEFPDTDEQEEN